MSDLYNNLPPEMRRSVDTLLDHAATALWPERRLALEKFNQGIANCDEQDRRQVLDLLGAEIPSDLDPTDVIYRILLTAYLQRLGETEINNPDQAFLFGQSLDRAHARATRQWLRDNPGHASN